MPGEPGSRSMFLAYPALRGIPSVTGRSFIRKAHPSPLLFTFHGDALGTGCIGSYRHIPVLKRGTMSSMKAARKYSSEANDFRASTKKLAKAAKLRARAAKLREQAAKYDAKIRALQRRIADLERKANLLAGQGPK